MISKADDTTEVGKIIVRIPLVDRECGKDLETVSYDPKHLTKRFWNTIIKERTSINNINIVKSDLAEMLLLGEGVQPLEVESLVHPKDKQNVPAATKFMLLFIEVLEDNEAIQKIPFRLQGIIPEMSTSQNFQWTLTLSCLYRYIT